MINPSTLDKRFIDLKQHPELKSQARLQAEQEIKENKIRYKAEQEGDQDLKKWF